METEETEDALVPSILEPECSSLHHLLLSLLDFPVVATSGNLSDDPI